MGRKARKKPNEKNLSKLVEVDKSMFVDLSTSTSLLKLKRNFYQGLKNLKMNLLSRSKWPSIIGFTHGRCISIAVKDVLILNIDPYF
jgi:hypothetical protein